MTMKNTSRDLLLQRAQPLGVFQGARFVVDRAGPGHEQQTPVLLEQDPADGVAGRHHGPRAPPPG